MFFKFSFVVTAHISSSRKGKFTFKFVLFLAEFCRDSYMCNYDIILYFCQFFNILSSQIIDYVQCCQNPVIYKKLWSSYRIFVKLVLSQRMYWLCSLSLHKQRALKLSSCLWSGLVLHLELSGNYLIKSRWIFNLQNR